MGYHSQCGEDKWIAEELKRPIKTFCEVGAYDGVLSSNTLYFEEQGADGLLIEPDPFMAAQSQRNRKAATICCAAGSICGLNNFMVNTQDRGLSGIARPGDYTIPVMVQTLRFLLAMTGFSNLDLLSIDTEGSELDVWEGIGSLRPKLVIMEYQTCSEPPQDEKIVDAMRAAGYGQVHRTQYNLIFQLL